MKLAAPIVLLILHTLSGSLAHAQTSPGLSVPVLKLEDDYLLISYDILNASRRDIFQIRMEATDTLGKKLLPVTISGDIGPDIAGGEGRLIRWDIGADKIAKDQGIYVQLFGRIADTGESVGAADPPARSVSISRMGALGRSFIFPGWGLSSMNPGKPHWIKGIAGYSSLCLSLSLNRMAHANYQNYLDSGVESERISYYDKSIVQENVSMVLAYATATIWVSDLIWTLFGTRGIAKGKVSLTGSVMAIGYDYAVTANIPLLSLRYGF